MPERRSSQPARWPWHALALVGFALSSYLIWRGYQHPDFILELGALRIC